MKGFSRAATEELEEGKRLALNVRETSFKFLVAFIPKNKEYRF